MQPEDIPKNTEYSRYLFKNALEKSLDINSIAISIADPSIVYNLLSDYARDREFDNVYRNPAVILSWKISSFTVKTNFVFRDVGVDWTFCMNITQRRAHDIAERPKRDTAPTHTITWRRFENQWKFTWKAEFYARASSRNYTLYGLLQRKGPSDTKWTTIKKYFITPFPKTRQKNVRILNVVEKLSKMIHSIPVPQRADALTIGELLKEHI